MPSKATATDVDPTEMGLTPEDVRILTEPFPESEVGYRVGSFNRETRQREILAYAPWAAYVHKLNTVDPSWSYKILKSETHLLEPGQVGFEIEVALTIKGITRQAIAAGLIDKTSTGFFPFEMGVMGAESDALKRAAAKFGVGLQFYENKVLLTREEAEQKAAEQDKKFSGGGSSSAGARPASTGGGTRPASTGGGSGTFQLSEGRRKRLYAIAKHAGFESPSDYLAANFPGYPAEDGFFTVEQVEAVMAYDFGN